METLCEPVVWPVQPAEVVAAAGDTRPEARVRRPNENPNAEPETPEAAAVKGFDLSAYTYRSPEAGVQAGGIWGRWFVSLSAPAATPERTVRPTPIRLDMGKPLEIDGVLSRGAIGAVIHVAGANIAGANLINEMISSPDLVEEITAARRLNPHRSPVPNGRIAVGDAVVTVGCTIPKIPVDITGLDAVYRSQSSPLFRAGIESMSWIFAPDGSLRTGDLYSQINWTLVPNAEVVFGTWTETAVWEYNRPDYTAYRKEIGDAAEKYKQPGIINETQTDAAALNKTKLRIYLTEITKWWNQVNADSNVIRGLQILGGNERIRQQPKRVVGFEENKQVVYSNTGGPTGGGQGTQFVWNSNTNKLEPVIKTINL